MTLKQRTQYYDEQREVGFLHQDQVAEVLEEYGWILTGIKLSRRLSLRSGENNFGVEIKLDTQFNETGNLYIEVAEKSAAENKFFVLSGIMSNHNWLYLIGDVIGDDKTFWIFSTRQLRREFHNWRFAPSDTGTALGYLMPLAEADRMCIRKFATIRGKLRPVHMRRPPLPKELRDLLEPKP